MIVCQTSRIIRRFIIRNETGTFIPVQSVYGAVTASALLELSGYGDKKQGEEYFRYAEHILKQLSSDDYLAQEGENHGFVLLHSVGSFPHDSEIDTPLNYADYYYLVSEQAQYFATARHQRIIA